MIEDGQIAGWVKVIVGKADPSTPDADARQHHLLRDAQPYWHVSAGMVRDLIAPNVLSYLKPAPLGDTRRSPSDGTLLDPAKVDWRASHARPGREGAALLPGPAEWGRLKIPFPNVPPTSILHDTPTRMSTRTTRSLHHGCIRLGDAQRLGR